MCYDKWALIVNIFVAIGTIGAVLFAIYKDLFKSWRNRPILKCELENPPIYSIKDKFKPIEYCRLEIRNTGKSSLKTVEVMISDLKKKEGDQFVKVESFSPDNLIWIFLGKEHHIPWGTEKIYTYTEDEIYCPYISPDTRQLCTLGNITDQYDQNIYNIIFELNVRFKSKNKYYLLQEGIYQTEITIGAENAEAIKKYYEITISKSEPKFLIKEISSKMIHKKLGVNYN